MPTLKSIYDSYTGLPHTKCSYVRFCLRIRKGFTPEQAIVAPRIYKKKKRTVKGIKEEIKTLKKEMSQYKEPHDKYRALQKEKDRLVRILSVYKNK